MKLYHDFKNTIQKQSLVKKNDTVILGVSGGADSMALLHLFYEIAHEYSLKIVVAHVNYQTRGLDAEQDEALVRTVCEDMGIDVEVLRIDGKKHTKNFEAWARDTRYRFFEKTKKHYHATRIATAHTMNDQAETILLHLIKGSGIGGLGAMHVSENDLIRPLLGFQKSELVEYLERQGVAFREDLTNLDTTYARNKVRHELLPQLAREFNPNIIETLARESEIFQQAEEYFAMRASGFIHRYLLGKKIQFPQKAFMAEAPLVQYAVIQMLMKQLGITTPPSYGHFQQIAHILNQNVGNKSKELTKGLKLRVYRGVISLTKTKN